jgi:CheY-like chemotaxis protein
MTPYTSTRVSGALNVKFIPNHYILYAEDDPDDQLFFKEMMDLLCPEITVVFCWQGLELIQYLHSLKTGDYLPSCIILDVNMPLWDGLRTLKEIRKDRLFEETKIIMFTTSASKHESQSAIIAGADAFITKPVDYKNSEDIMKRFVGLCQEVPRKLVRVTPDLT